MLVWYSDGAASAVAAYFAVQKYGERCEVVKADTTPDEHPDNLRFRAEVEAWIGRKVKLIRSEKYAGIDDVFERTRYMAGIDGARCTTELKKIPRREYQRPDDIHVFGYTADEAHRIARFEGNNPELTCDWILRDKQITKDDCYYLLDRAGIELPEMYRLGYDHNNCFHGATRFITDGGIRSLGECAGEAVRVLGSNAGWKDATVESFGVQPLVELVLTRYGTEKTILTTADHRWFVRTRRAEKREVLTRDLRPGDPLYSMHSRVRYNVRPSAFGVAHGIVFGDGTMDRTQWNGPARVLLCGDKNAELLRWFPNSPARDVEGVGVEVLDLPRSWNSPPDLSESQSYLYGWLAGYFAADGVVSDSQVILHSADRQNLEVVADVCARIGVATGSIKKRMRTGYGDTPSALYSVSLVPSTLREDFFLIEQHRQRFASRPRAARPADWRVKSIRPTGRSEEVFCAVVADGAAFTLEDNIFTGNCLGCVKATSPAYWARTRLHFPEAFERRARQSREIGARLVRIDGERVFLDEIPEDFPVDGDDGEIECGPFCEMQPSLFAGESEAA